MNKQYQVSFMHGVPVVEAMYSPITFFHACQAAMGRGAEATPDVQLRAQFVSASQPPTRLGFFTKLTAVSKVVLRSGR